MLELHLQSHGLKSWATDQVDVFDDFCVNGLSEIIHKL